MAVQLRTKEGGAVVAVLPRINAHVRRADGGGQQGGFLVVADQVVQLVT